MNIKFLKFLVFFMGLLIIVGIILLSVGIYYKINNFPNKTQNNTLIIKKLPKLDILDYYINNDKIIINYQDNNKNIMHIYNLANGKLIKEIEILK